MPNLVSERLTTEEFLMLQEMLGNGALMTGLRKIFGTAEHERLEGMRAEALGHGRASEITKYAAESRTFSEWEHTIKKGMERLAPQRR